jgi:hypothetical protein
MAIKFEIKFYIFDSRNFPVSLEQQQKSRNFFKVTSKESNLPMETSYDLSCIDERDLSDYFKYMYQGSLQVNLLSAKSGKLIATASLPINSLLRQGREEVVKGFKSRLCDPMQPDE